MPLAKAQLYTVCPVPLRSARQTRRVRLRFEPDVLRNIRQQGQAPAPVNRLPQERTVTAYCLSTFQYKYPAAEQRPIRRCWCRLPER